MLAKINAFATSCYRYMLNVKRTDRIRNKDLLATINEASLMSTVIERQLRWLGHALRKGDSQLIGQLALYCSEHGRRKRDRPRTTHQKYILLLTGLQSVEEVKRLAKRTLITVFKP